MSSQGQGTRHIDAVSRPLGTRPSPLKWGTGSGVVFAETPLTEGRSQSPSVPEMASLVAKKRLADKVASITSGVSHREGLSDETRRRLEQR